MRYFIVIGFFLIANSVFAQQSPTPVPSPAASAPVVESAPAVTYTDAQFYPVVVARRPIARGEQFAAGMLSVVHMPGDVLNDMLAMDNIFSAAIYTDHAQLEGVFASVDIQPFQPITAHMIAPQNPFGTLPWGKSYPATLATANTRHFLVEPEPGAQVDVFALTTFAGIAESVPVRLVSAAEILDVDAESILITMSAHGDRLNIMQLADAGVEMLLVPTGSGTDDFDLAALFER
jgi:hypothetical protein